MHALNKGYSTEGEIDIGLISGTLTITSPKEMRVKKAGHTEKPSLDRLAVNESLCLPG